MFNIWHNHCDEHGMFWSNTKEGNCPKCMMRVFDSGATKSFVTGKPQYEGYLSPLVIHEFGKYMLKHSKQLDDKIRTSDNWQKGIPLYALMDSMWRHFMDIWCHHRGWASIAREPLKDALCAVLFNVQAYLHTILLNEQGAPPVCVPPSTTALAKEIGGFDAPDVGMGRRGQFLH